jgi:hypothetical protein
MNTTKTQHSGADLQDALGRAIVARLDHGTENLPHDITERLKVARMRAVAQRKLAAAVAPAAAVLGSAGQASLQMGEGLRGLWMQLGAWLPLLALVTGLVVIGAAQDDWSAQEIAEVDTELLTDNLPPSAYTDPGFAQFLRNNQEN